MAPPRVALFVEGSTEEKLRGGSSALGELWQNLAEAVGARPFSQIYGINKKHLLALDPGNPPMSGQAEPLDELLERMRRKDGFEAAIVAWDLVPRWNVAAELCRRAEVLDLYLFLSHSRTLPPDFKRDADLRYRAIQAGKPTPPYLMPGSILGLCMEPDFEVVFADLESAIFGSTGLDQRPKGWRSFKNAARYDQVLEDCVAAIPRGERPRHLPSRWVNGKNAWAGHFLKHCLENPAARALLLRSAPLLRLSAIAGS